MTHLVDCLEYWTQKHPDKLLYSFLDARGRELEHYTFQQFHERVFGLARQLADEAGIQHGDRVLLVYPPGLEMIVAFFASLNLGAIPVPVCAPVSMNTGAGAARIEHVARDCGACIALTTSSYLRGIAANAKNPMQSDEAQTFLASLRWCPTDTMTDREMTSFRRQSNPILFLQYTSGSTGDPKGVIVTHRNVIHNAHETIHPGSIGVSWLPQYHDMGLIGHYLFAVVIGGTNHGFSPFDFLIRPTLWLQTLSRVRATLTAAPNFAFGYCLREDKVPDSALCDVDLSSLEGMMTAAEPIHPQTYARFYARFSRYGLRRESYYGCYGLAENTLAVSTRGRQTLHVQKQRMQRRQLSIQKTMTRNNNQLALVSCGPPFKSIDVRIVDPESCASLGENAIGEIWIDGESKCAGYWERPEISEAIFHARIANEADNPRDYLRTGDLGFLHEGELFVCGRIKDMIIIHGVNYYPQDIEAIIETEFPEASPQGQGRVAAFSLDHDGEERLIVVMEVSRQQDRLDPAKVAQAIRARYFIDPYQVLFVPPRSISKTTSGKVARSKTREMWLSGELEILESYVHADFSRPKSTPNLKGLFDSIRELYNLNGDENVTLADIGLDSLTLVDLTLKIQSHFEHMGLGELVANLDARFLQRLSVAEMSRLLNVYDTGSELPVAELRVWLSSRQREDDAQERKLMLADARWLPPAEPALDACENPRSILMTGATGFFGPFLLGSLLQRTECEIEVVVRAADQSHGRDRIVDALRRAELWTPEVQEKFLSRVRVVCGDLGLARLGLNDQDWERLCRESDAIVHNGAQVNYVHSYEALRPYNVGGTRELLTLAATGRKKPFHHISSTFIHGWSARPIAAEHEFNEELEELDFGYSQTKCIQEHMVLNAARQGQPVRIYRPTLITASARGVGSREDIGVRLLAFMIKYGISVEALNQISFLPADIVSDHIARIFSLRETESNIFHVTTTKYYNMMDVTRSITEQFGYTFTYYDTPRFVEEVNRLCTPEDPLYPLLVFLNRSQHKFKPMEPKRYDNRHYRAALECAKPDVFEPKMADTVARIVAHLQRERLISAAPFVDSTVGEAWAFAPEGDVALGVSNAS
ncbi:MAG: thioester reductase domain-containing protein [Candidatus Hydrogenedentes bacterium]|nr:thioester reductase domain-containing protein [Candidatus Hydrogenedentota bacterium]